MNRLFLCLAITTVTCAAASAAAAQQARPQRPEAQPKVWTRAATEAEIKQAFAGIDRTTLPPGKVSLSCRVKADGTFTDCQIISTTPSGRRRDPVVAFEGKKSSEIAPASTALPPVQAPQPSGQY